MVALNGTVITSSRRRRGDFFKGMYGRRSARMKSSSPYRSPFEEGRLRQFPNPASRFALVGVFVAQLLDGSARRGHRRSAFRVPRGALEAALSKSFTADAAKGVRSIPLDSTTICMARHRIAPT